jgi:hypothetical protein
LKLSVEFLLLILIGYSESTLNLLLTLLYRPVPGHNKFIALRLAAILPPTCRHGIQMGGAVMWGGGIYTCNHNLDFNATIYRHPHFMLLIVLVYFSQVCTV